jgi:helix-turn-helix protein
MKPDPAQKKCPGENRSANPKTAHDKNEGNSPQPGTIPFGWLDKQEIMERMHISSRTLQKWRSKGLLPYSPIGGKIYYPESGLEKLLLDNLRT